MKYFRRIPIIFFRTSEISLRTYSKNNWVYSYLDDKMMTRVSSKGPTGYSQIKYNQSDSL